MELFETIRAAEMVSTLVYTGLGVSLLYVCWLVLDMLTPFSLAKSIEGDRNVAVAIVVASIFVSIAIVIAAVILS